MWGAHLYPGLQTRLSSGLLPTSYGMTNGHLNSNAAECNTRLPLVLSHPGHCNSLLSGVPVSILAQAPSTLHAEQPERPFKHTRAHPSSAPRPPVSVGAQACPTGPFILHPISLLTFPALLVTQLPGRVAPSSDILSHCCHGAGPGWRLR